MNTKTILVPTDFSASSENAGRYAASLAKELGASVQLVHIYQEYPAVALSPEPWVFTVNDIVMEMEKQMTDTVKMLRETYDITVSGEVRRGLRGDTIVETASDSKVSLVVMGVHSGPRSRIWGSTVYKTVRSSSVPVLIIPEGANYRTVKNMVLAVDFKEMPRHATFEPLYELYKHFGASLCVLHVVQAGEQRTAKEAPQRIEFPQALSKFNYQSETIGGENVEQGLHRFLSGHPADMLVMVAHQHTVFQRLFGQVHTRAMSLELTQPMLVLNSACAL